MALILQNGSVFLHLPKTGGNWVTHVLRKMNLVHSEIGHKHSDATRTAYALGARRAPTLSEIIRLRLNAPTLPPDSTFMFTFVRNPLSWYESWYKYQMQDTRRWTTFGSEGAFSDWHPNAVLNQLGNNEFNTFVANVLRKRPGYVSELFFSYTTPEVGFVGKQENIRIDLCNALLLGNEKFDEDLIMSSDPVGVSTPPIPEPEWHDEVRRQATKLEMAAIVRYGYEESIQGWT